MLNTILLAAVLVALPPGLELSAGQLNIKPVKTYATMHECQKAAKGLQAEIDSDKDIMPGMKIVAKCFKPSIGVEV